MKGDVCVICCYEHQNRRHWSSELEYIYIYKMVMAEKRCTSFDTIDAQSCHPKCSTFVKIIKTHTPEYMYKYVNVHNKNQHIMYYYTQIHKYSGAFIIRRT